MKPAPGPATRAAQGLQQREAARSSVSGEPRTPWCGMGLCGECRVQVEGVGTVLACLWPLRDEARDDGSDHARDESSDE